MEKLKNWTIETEDCIFKIDMEKISFDSKNSFNSGFEDFYYQPGKKHSNAVYFEISPKFIIKDIAIYFNHNNFGYPIILCLKNNKNIVKTLGIKGHPGPHDLSVNVLTAPEFHCACGHSILKGKPLEIIKDFDDLSYDKIDKFKRNNNCELI